ncbi:MAG: hypothetical protein ABJP48_00165 [Erythrobacter sp.]
MDFPKMVVFRSELLAGIHSFSEKDSAGWLWSRELIEAAKAAGIKGPAFISVGGPMVVGFAYL